MAGWETTRNVERREDARGRTYRIEDEQHGEVRVRFLNDGRIVVTAPLLGKRYAISSAFLDGTGRSGDDFASVTLLPYARPDDQPPGCAS